MNIFLRYFFCVSQCIAFSDILFAQSGRLDPSFIIGSGANTLNANAVQPDGKILIGGFLLEYNGTPITGIARLNKDGSLDTSFNPGAGPSGGINSGGYGGVNVILPLLDGKILIAGNFNSFDGMPRHNLARLHANGSLDVTFDTGAGTNDEIISMILLPDGNILVGGKFTTAGGISRNYLARFHPDGTFDQTFDPSTSISEITNVNGVYSIISEPDGSIYVAGPFRSDNGNSAKNGLVRLLENGSVDPMFNTAGIGSNSTIWRVLQQPDGKFLIMGDFTSYNGTPVNRIARINPDGSIDTTFNTGVGVNGVGHYGFIVMTDAILQPDGKVILTGDFSAYENTPYSGIVRLNPDGTLDRTFDPGTGANNLVWAVSLLPDSRVLISGNFTSFDGQAMSSVALLKNCYNIFTVQRVTACKQYVFNGITLTESGQYIQVINKANGCDSTITLHLRIECPLVFPNLVTANADGINDYLEILIPDNTFGIEIYNRWGSLIYKSERYTQDWPRDAKNGLYFYIIYNDTDVIYKSWLQVIE